jgi:Domain of unknown function (DUF4159)
MTGQHPPLVQRFLDKVSRSRDFSISIAIHVILVALFGSTILFQIVNKPEPEFVASEPAFVTKKEHVASKPVSQPLNEITPMKAVTTIGSGIPIIAVKEGEFPTSLNITPISTKAFLGTVPMNALSNLTTGVAPDGLTAEARKAIQGFAATWRGSSAGSREPDFQFTAYLGQYQGGNWASTVRISEGKIETGSLPNLLYLMSYWTKDKVRTNYKNVQAIRLDSDELFTVKPPFIFLTGTRDFALTDKEVENLRNYLRLGGCVWGDSSVPGKNSPFDIAFKREMRRVVGGHEDFTPLPSDHPLFTQAYFREVKGQPPGLNFYKLPISVLKMYGEIAVIYTANDYGDMWQIGLNSKGEIDLQKGRNGQYVAVNDNLYSQRGVYVRNVSPEALESSFKFGANVVMHLLTRWENRLGPSASL